MDVLTVQEYMGYCLLPTNRAQKMLIILGKGGEGKSRIGITLRYIYGDSMNTGSMMKLETNRFFRACQEYKLVMVDDDMKMVTLPETSYIKSMVTLEDKMDIERKGQQTHMGVMAYGKSYSNNYLEQKRVNNHDKSSYVCVEGDFPPIVTPEKWYRAQEIKAGRVKESFSAKKGNPAVYSQYRLLR